MLICLIFDGQDRLDILKLIGRNFTQLEAIQKNPIETTVATFDAILMVKKEPPALDQAKP
jgi:hypothetical protein